MFFTRSPLEIQLSAHKDYFWKKFAKKFKSAKQFKKFLKNLQEDRTETEDLINSIFEIAQGKNCPE